MPQDRKTLAGIEQTGDRRAKISLACIKICFRHIAMEIESMFPCYMKNSRDDGMCLAILHPKRERNESWLSNCRVQLIFCKTIQYNFFKKLMGVTTCNIVETLY